MKYLMSRGVPALFCVAVALLFGGGGSAAPASEMIVQVLTAAGFAAWAWCRAERADGGVPMGAWAMCFAVIIIPFIQLLPLPPALWHSLPGRGVEREALGLIGIADSWRSLSLFPGRTLASLLAMIASVALVPMVASLRLEQIAWLLAGVVALALLSVVVGVFQMAGVMVMRFYMPFQDLPVGFQASRNFQAEVLNLGILCAGAASRLGLGRRRMAQLGTRVMVANVVCTLLLVTAQVLAASRTGLALTAVAIAGQGVFLRPALGGLLQKRWALAGLALGVVALGVALVSVGDAQNAVDRFAGSDQTRIRLWHDAMAMGSQFSPVGAGFGSFLPLYEANERLDYVSPSYASRAHDDYLELMVETGWMGFGALAAVVALWGAQVRRLWRSGRDAARTMCVLSGLSLGFIALHSLVDYPLRSMTLAALSAVMVGLVFCREAALRPAEGAGRHSEMKVGE
jgi:exopolysaccharide production protein ExoQ